MNWMGAALGTIDVLDCVAQDDPRVAADVFAEGPYCWLLGDPEPFREPIPCQGAQSLWNFPDDLLPQHR